MTAGDESALRGVLAAHRHRIDTAEEPIREGARSRIRRRAVEVPQKGDDHG